ncbi:exported hypothetical protein [Mesorhizobium sp. STM 4661]|nr:exported hypothetical protein [Mesorhizobium sp. STM 4661]
MRLVLSVCLFLGLVYAAPTAAITLSKKEWKTFSCVLSKARKMGNPEVAANYAIDECPTEGSVKHRRSGSFIWSSAGS